MEQQIQLALCYLVQQQNLGYTEAVHKLTFPLPGPLGVKFETHKTVFFQRLIILNTLISAKKIGYLFPRSLVELETQEIIHSRHPQISGGWSYFPQIENFPPDLDDLAAAVQVASKLSNNTLNRICDESIEVVFQNCFHENGSIETWILDSRKGGEVISKIQECIKIIGGRGVHTEVIANFLEALCTYNFKKYNFYIRMGTSYLISIQNDIGSWDSKWYWGNYYGTYKAMQAISRINANGEAINKAINFFLREQRANGSWGHGPGDPLNTSFGILGLLVYQNKPSVTKSISMALDYLRKTQHPNGSWDSYPFIKMDSKNGLLSYESCTITTSYATYALISASKYVH